MDAVMEAVLTSVRGAVGVVQINRPDAHNAINTEVTRLLEESFDEFEASTEVNAIVLAGSGSKTFCAGMDLKEFAAKGPRGVLTKKGGFAGVTKRRFRLPTVAAVTGNALGGGLEIALACDMMVLNSEAVVGLPEVKRGLMAGGGGLVRLPRRIPEAIALQLAITGEPISAARAYELGLANRVCAPEDVVDVAIELATSVARNAPLAVASSREVIRRTVRLGESEAWEINKKLTNLAVTSEDAREGPRAFAEKRDPVWVSRPPEEFDI